jgi:rubrerythrin
MNHNVPVQSLIDHIKTAIDVDPWAKEMAEELLKEHGKTVKATRNNADGVWACGECGHPVFPSLLERYCPGCGKKVDYTE